jgi:hypothetical protein
LPEKFLGGKISRQYAAAWHSTQADFIVLNNLSKRGTFTASLPLLVMPPAGAVAGMLYLDRGQAGIGRIDHNELLGPPVKQAAPGCGRVRLPNAAFVVALSLASEGSSR